MLGAFGFGVPIDASWPDADFNHTGGEPTSDQWRRHWTRCVDEAAAADITLIFAQEGERQMGALVEAGECLGAGKRLYLVSPHAWPWPRSRRRHEGGEAANERCAGCVRRAPKTQIGRKHDTGIPKIGFRFLL